MKSQTHPIPLNNSRPISAEAQQMIEQLRSLYGRDQIELIYIVSDGKAVTLSVVYPNLSPMPCRLTLPDGNYLILKVVDSPIGVGAGMFGIQAPRDYHAPREG